MNPLKCQKYRLLTKYAETYFNAYNIQGCFSEYYQLFHEHHEQVHV